MLQNGNTKAINDLLLCGYTELVNQLKVTEENGEDTNEFINNEIPQLLVKIIHWFKYTNYIWLFLGKSKRITTSS